MSGGWVPFAQAVLSLCLTLGLLFLLAWAVRRWGPLPGMSAGGAKPRLRVVESRRLNPATTLYIIAKDAQEYMIAVSNGHVTLLDGPAMPACLGDAPPSPTPLKKAKVRA